MVSAAAHDFSINKALFVKFAPDKYQDLLISNTTITSIGKKLGLHTCFQIDKY
jgi:hypothetical protein